MAGYIARRYPEANINVIELDPMVVELAEKYFFFKKSPNMEIHAMDLRVYLLRNKKKYDLILLDTFYGETIPFHLTTTEFLQLVKARLKPGGVVSGHYWASDMYRYYHAQIKTYQSVFDELYILGLENSISHIFIAPRDNGLINKEEVLKRASIIAKERDFNFDLVKLIQDNFNDASNMKVTEQVLTDNYAPVNIMNIKSSKNPVIGIE